MIPVSAVKGWCFKETGVYDKREDGFKPVNSFASGIPSFVQLSFTGDIELTPIPPGKGHVFL